jgi:hypothetical protein
MVWREIGQWGIELSQWQSLFHQELQYQIGHQEQGDIEQFHYENGHNQRAGEATESSANTKGVDAFKIIRIFVKGNEVIGWESILNGGR